MDAGATIHHAFVRDIERIWFDRATPAALQRALVHFIATTKPFNMSESYARLFGFGAREHVQNWMDECRVRAGTGELTVHSMEDALLSDIAQRHPSLADAKAYAAFDEDRLLGMLLDCTSRAGEQLLFLKNYGAQMTLDNLILGESTKRSNMALAGQNKLFAARATLAESLKVFSTDTTSVHCIPCSIPGNHLMWHSAKSD